IQLVTSGLEERALAPEQFELVNHLCIQLVRNAVTHGIEQPADRLNAGKPEVGRIDIRLAEIAGNQLELTVRDDGQGFNYKAIRERALSLKMRSDTELDCMNNRELLSLIFEPGFSTAAEVNEDAGRGVGMDIIRREINNSGGKLKISSAKERYCEFTVTLPLIEAVQSAA
ncbi:ATP-binding protein, partial [Litorivivens sp.]|uniref:ATP-binding protein n=1 Tax=Litorivivens sp. TaxID=2020868 RepID=UPI00356A2BFC